MDAHPVRAVSWFKQRKGRITEWEKEEIGKAVPTRLAALRSAQLQYDFLYEQAVYQFTQQVAELRDFIAIYGEGLDPEFKRLVAECIGFDPQSGKDIVSDPEQLGKYLASLEKTLDRWNDLCKEFRKAPYNLERALKGRYGSVAGGMKGEAVTSLVELELALQMRKLGKEREQMQERLENLRATREDVEARLKSVVQHKRAGDTVYKLAMDMREKELKELDEGEVRKDGPGDV
jgi:hypothetical protein